MATKAFVRAWRISTILEPDAITRTSWLRWHASGGLRQAVVGKVVVYIDSKRKVALPQPIKPETPLSVLTATLAYLSRWGFDA